MSDQARYQRFVQDAALTQAVPLPAAAASAFTPYIDLGATEPGSVVDDFDVLVSIDATPNLTNGGSITCVLQQSADGVTFAAVPIFAPLVVTGPSSGGGAQASFVLKLPPTIQQYIRLEASVSSGGGNVTANNATLALVF